jgi:carbon monoxide dehydrogenase subunit G
MTAVSGSYRAQVAPDRLWSALSDPARLGEVMPDVGVVDVHDADSFSAYVRPSTNLGITPLNLDVRITEREVPARVRIAGDGRSGEHRVAFDMVLVLAGGASGGTDVTWQADVRASGILGSLTQRVLPMLLRDQVAGVLATAEAQA